VWRLAERFSSVGWTLEPKMAYSFKTRCPLSNWGDTNGWDTITTRYGYDTTLCETMQCDTMLRKTIWIRYGYDTITR